MAGKSRHTTQDQIMRLSAITRITDYIIYFIISNQYVFKFKILRLSSLNVTSITISLQFCTFSLVLESLLKVLRFINF